MPSWKKVITSGSDASLNSLYAPSITGSLLGTASYAIYAETASYSNRTLQTDVLVKNQSGANIAKGVVVRITGSNNASDIPRVVTASYEADNNSANTLGITTAAITNGSDGYVVTEGILTGVDTSAFTSGQLLYLGATGSIIGTAPVAPLHSVRLGEVIRQQSNNGSIYVRIDNGYEIEELHDVLITSASSGDLLVRSASIWINSKQLSGSYGLTGSLNATSFTGSLLGTASYATTALSASYAPDTTFPYTGSAIISGSLTVTGSLNLSGLGNGSVLFATGSNGAITGSSNLFWDNTNSRLGIGTASPSATLHTVGSITASGAIARGNYMQPTLVAAANNDVTVGLDITPTFTNGAFTGVTNLALRATGQVRFNASGEVSSFQGYGTDILRIVSNNNGMLEIGQNLATPITPPPGKTAIYNRNNTYNALTICVTDGQLGYGSKIRWNNGLAAGGAIYHSDAVLYDMGLQNQAGHYLHMFANGNVLLTNGTRTDAGYKLDVNGTARVQGKLSVNTPTAASAVMEVTSTTQGFLPPRTNLTSNISTPAQGLMTYITASATEGLYYYNSGSYQNWTRILNNTGSQIISGSLLTNDYIGVSGTGTGVRLYGSNNNAIPGYFQFLSNGGASTGGYLNYTYHGQFTFADTNVGIGAKLGVRGSGNTSSTTSLLVQSLNASSSLVVLDNNTVGIRRTPTASLDVAGTTRISGSFNTATSGSILTVIGSGSAQPILLVTGSTGQLFSVTDTNSGSLLQIYDDSSNSIFEITSDAEVKYGVSSSIFASKLTPISTTSSYATIYNISTGSYTGAFVNYTATSASNARAGQLMAVWNNGTASYTEISTTDIGNTSAISFAVIMTSSLARIAVSSSLTTGWQIKTALNII